MNKMVQIEVNSEFYGIDWQYISIEELSKNPFQYGLTNDELTQVLSGKELVLGDKYESYTYSIIETES